MLNHFQLFNFLGNMLHIYLFCKAFNPLLGMSALWHEYTPRVYVSIRACVRACATINLKISSVLIRKFMGLLDLRAN